MNTSIITQAATIPLSVLLQQKKDMERAGRTKFVAFINSVIAYKLADCHRNDNPISM